MTTSDKTVNYLQELVEKAYKLDLLKKCRELEDSSNNPINLTNTQNNLNVVQLFF